MGKMYYSYLETDIGSLMLAGDGEALMELGFPSGKGARRHHRDWVLDGNPFEEIKEQLVSYFSAGRREFSIPLAPQGTDFQLQVWQALQTIPYGETLSYAELASRIGRPRAFRAVGAANGQNPIPIIIPCHRVIGSSGKLVGFGGGLDTKQHLLGLEYKSAQASLPF
ncbi:MAG: methylated-DNA--[protein]-cysteine S-methyltransferase [Gammaproteobacteria bacterium]|nr:methylated-DNA--[protein]-cysteine S-methyltransferase [Gammaproteobacteria bacterium]